MPIEYVELPQFKRDFLKLKKKFRTLPEDFTLVKKAALEIFHYHHIDNQSVFEISALGGKEPVYKLKKFACRSLKGRGNRSGLRITYAWNKEFKRITLIEIYYQEDKKNEDKGRIKQYLKLL